MTWYNFLHRTGEQLVGIYCRTRSALNAKLELPECVEQTWYTSSEDEHTTWMLRVGTHPVEMFQLSWKAWLTFCSVLSEDVSGKRVAVCLFVVVLRQRVVKIFLYFQTRNTYKYEFSSILRDGIFRSRCKSMGKIIFYLKISSIVERSPPPYIIYWYWALELKSLNKYRTVRFYRSCVVVEGRFWKTISVLNFVIL